MARGVETEAQRGERAAFAGCRMRLCPLSKLDRAAALWPGGETEARGHMSSGTRQLHLRVRACPGKRFGWWDRQGDATPGFLILLALRGEDLSSPPPPHPGRGLSSTRWGPPKRAMVNHGGPGRLSALLASHFVPGTCTVLGTEYKLVG